MAATEALNSKYGDRIHFIIVYVIEAHPVGSSSPYSKGEEWTGPASMDAAGCDIFQPASYEERVTTARQMAAELGITVPVLIDEMDDAVWYTYGPAPNLAYLIDFQGKIYVKQGWFQPDEMEKAIIDYLKGAGN